MWNDEEKKITDGEESEPRTDDIFSEEGREQQTEEDSSYAYRKMENAELWREPVYRQAETGNKVYSPSYHDASSNTSFPVLEPQREKKRVRREKKDTRPFWRVLCLVLGCAILSAGISAGVTAAVLRGRLSEQAEKDSSVVVIGGNSSAVTGSTADPENVGKTIYEQACKQVVGLKTEMTTTNIFGQETSSAVSGTGFLLSANGYILTNYHVVEYAGQNNALSVMLYGSEETYPAQIIAFDEDNDVAVVKIEAEGLTPVSFEFDLTVGETVYCVGNPLGELDYTMTSGIVSALDRAITTESGVSISMFQIDAAVNSGNSGGPVYNREGKVVGVVTAKYGSGGIEGLGFAIPIQDAVSIATDLIEYGYVSGRAFLGINGETVSSGMSRYYQLPAGVYVTQVYSGSGSEAAGVKVGDVETKLGDTEITGLSQLKTALQDYGAGDEFTITVYRNGEMLELSGVMAEKTPEAIDTQREEERQEQQNTITMPDIFRFFPWG